MESSMVLNTLDPGLHRDDVVSGKREFMDRYQLERRLLLGLKFDAQRPII